MIVAIVRKIFDNHDKVSTSILPLYIPILYKFILNIFNQLSHDQNISGLFIISYLLNFLNYHFPKVIVKIFNIALL